MRNARGRYPRLAMGFKNRFIKVLTNCGFEGTLRDDIFMDKLGMEINLVNIYGPCQERMVFYESLIDHSFMNVKNLIV